MNTRYALALDVDRISAAVGLALALGHFGLGAGVSSLARSALLEEVLESTCPENWACAGGTMICCGGIPPCV